MVDSQPVVQVTEITPQLIAPASTPEFFNNLAQMTREKLVEEVTAIEEQIATLRVTTPTHLSDEAIIKAVARLNETEKGGLTSADIEEITRLALLEPGKEDISQKAERVKAYAEERIQQKDFEEKFLRCILTIESREKSQEEETSLESRETPQKKGTSLEKIITTQDEEQIIKYINQWRNIDPTILDQLNIYISKNQQERRDTATRRREPARLVMNLRAYNQALALQSSTN